MPRGAPHLLSMLVYAALAGAAAPCAAQSGGWKPNKPVDVVLGVSPGGGIDRMDSRDLASYFDAQYAQFKSILTELGLAR